jgi:nitroreductase
MIVCPEGAIEIHGRTLSPDDIYDLPPGEDTAKYDHLMALLQRRRSIRKFNDKPIADEDIEKIIAAARTAPMGLPPSDVNLLIFKGKEKSRAFANDFCNYLEAMKWFVSPWFLALMRPFWGKANDEVFRGFVKPMFKIYTEKMKQGENVVNYDPPLLIYFYGSPYCDPADPIIAATYAMIAAEALGLGTIMLGAVHPMIQSGRKAKKFRQAHGIKYPSREGVFVAIGYPGIKFNQGIKRTFASVEYY